MTKNVASSDSIALNRLKEDRLSDEIGRLRLFFKMIMFWDWSDSVVLQGFQWKSMSPSHSASNLHETVFLSQIFQILTIVVLYTSPSNIT